MATQITITSGTSWTVPADWNPGDNRIEVIGAGAKGSNGENGSKTSAGDGGNGGHGGAFSGISNFSAVPGASLTINIGANGGDTWLSNTGSAPTTTSQGVLAKGGNLAPSSQIAQGVGTVKHAGGNRTSGSGATSSGNLPGVGGDGGGAAGSASNASGRTKGSMTEPWSGVGPGDGGEGATGQSNPGGPGGNYGGGGGGGSGGRKASTGNTGGVGGAGAPGIIVITYEPLTARPTSFGGIIA